MIFAFLEFYSKFYDISSINLPSKNLSIQWWKFFQFISWLLAVQEKKTQKFHKLICATETSLQQYWTLHEPCSLGK